MATPRVAAAAAAPAVAVVKPGLRRGREARLAFWQTMWFPLVAFLFASHGPDVNRHRYINAIFFLVFQLGLSAWIYYTTHGNERAADAVDKWVRFAGYVGGVPNFMCRSFLMLSLIGEENWMGATKAAYEDILTNAALAYLIFLYFFDIAGADWRERTACIMAYISLMIGTTLTVYIATEDGLVEIGSLVVYFKTAALVALVCCAPHLYPGLTLRRSFTLLSFFILVVLPLALGGVWLLQQYEIADNDTIIAKVDDYKYHLGAVYLMLCETLVEWADKE